MAGTEGAQRTAAGPEPSRANLAAGLAIAAVVVWAVLIAVDADGPIWIVEGVLALAAAAAGWRAGGGAMPRGRPLAALIVGGVLFLLFVAFTIAEA